MTPARIAQMRRGIHLARSPFSPALETTLTQHAYWHEKRAIVKRKENA